MEIIRYVDKQKDIFASFAWIIAFGTDEQKNAAIDGFKRGAKETNQAAIKIANEVAENVRKWR